MAEILTAQQRQAVENTGGKLLVSAAAGSGKTKVLVDRLMRYLTDPVDPANIDDFLIITYTKAAAAELRGKIAKKLSEHLLADPDNRHLQRQMQRLYMTQISTVHSFCTDLLRNYAYRLDIAGDFRVAEENECEEIQAEVLDRLLEDVYEHLHEDAEVRTFMDTQGLGRDDRQVPQIILQVFNSARCHLNPDAWLEWCISTGDVSHVNDAAETVWGKFLINDLQNYLDLQICAMSRCEEAAKVSAGMEKPAALLATTVDQLVRLRNCTKWDDIRDRMNIDYGRLTFSKKCEDAELADQIKAVREACKKGVAKKLKRFTDSGDRVLQDIAATSLSTQGLVKLTRRFINEFAQWKRSRRIVDFGDLEHITLDLLLGKQRTGATTVAMELGDRYREVMVDEYQDSNEVQDAIFTAITGKRNNCFMVGDVKQSIYRFRLADPGIFLKKYNAYAPAESAKEGQGRKVLLSSNFRSAGPVIEAVNHVFRHCMSVDVGGLEYGKDEALSEGITHVKIDEPEIELHAIDVLESSYDEEAAFIAKRICELTDGTHMIREEKSVRPIRPDDIVILLRSPGSVGTVYAKALEAYGIRCSYGGSANILQTEEIQLLRALLQVVDNPLQDIPLLTVLTSRVFGFSADLMASIRSQRRNCSIFSAVCSAQEPEAKAFVDHLNALRSASRMLTLPQLIQEIFLQTKLDSIYDAMPDGDIRTENLQAFCQLAAGFDSGNRSLPRFLKHIDALDEQGIASGAEQSASDAVTIMSIHKSKGLEFPVVFLAGLSRSFNREDAREQVLSDKDLGLGLSCVDVKNRVRYPSIAKRAINLKMLRESLSEELRVLYVAMTRPKDRLIMTYATKDVGRKLSDIVRRMDISDKTLLTCDVPNPGDWILMSALRRSEAGAFFALGGYPQATEISQNPWRITVSQCETVDTASILETGIHHTSLSAEQIARMRMALSFEYAHKAATDIPSKQTATQIKGRIKDQEAAEETEAKNTHRRSWRKPGFITGKASGKDYGTAMHSVLQYIRYEACGDVKGVDGELSRLQKERYISEEQAQLVDSKKIANFFTTEIGKKVRSSNRVLREFKFSILDDASRYGNCVENESVLLQGVVDCAIIEDDGITVIDFKTDKVTPATIDKVAESYRTQVTVYADAMSRIYRMPVKSVQLYFFSAEMFVTM